MAVPPTSRGERPAFAVENLLRASADRAAGHFFDGSVIGIPGGGRGVQPCRENQSQGAEAGPRAARDSFGIDGERRRAMTGRPRAVMVRVDAGIADSTDTLIDVTRDRMPSSLVAGRMPIAEKGKRC